MDKEGYPEALELRLIKQWHHSDLFNLIAYLEERWTYKDWGFIKEWGKDDLFKKPTLFLELHTGGWSGNESLIDAFLKNDYIKHFCYVEWRRGGHYKFEIKADSLGFMPVLEMAKKKNVSRQRVHHSAHYYDWITMGERTKLVREKTPETK